MNRKFYRVLTLGVSLMLAGNLTVSAQKVTFHGEQVPLKQAFEKIESVSKYKIAYNPSLLDVNKLVVLNYKDKDVLKVLESLLKGTGCTYQINDNYIVITPLQKGIVKKVQGTVKDTKGDPIIGATIVEKGTTNGAITDYDGNFVLTIKNGADIEISYIGFKTQTVSPLNEKNIIVTMKEDTEMLDEVVVVGYGMQKKSNITSSVKNIKSDQILGVSTPNVQNMLQGKIAGVQVYQSGGKPGEKATIRVRGKSSLGSSVDPLWVVDGIIQVDDPNLNPQDIESLTVLKDAAPLPCTVRVQQVA